MNKSKQTEFGLSRRDFLWLGLGGLGAVFACACGGLGITAYLLVSRRSRETDDSLAIATSAVNRVDVVKNVEQPLILARTEWGGLEPNHEAVNEFGWYSPENPEGWRVYDGDLREVYKTLVVHHSVVDSGDDLSTLTEIQTLHRDDRGWADVAYHYFIGAEGQIYAGRDMAVRGTHVAGYNTGSLGICLLGNFMENSPSEAQLTALVALARWLTLRLQVTHLASHRDFNTHTVCPGDNLVAYITDVAALVGLTYGTDGYNGPVTPTEEVNP